jgi:hypothetical protein
MHTDLNVPVFEFNRRSVRPNLEFAQLFRRDILQCAYPLSWNQEAGIAARDDLDGITLGNVAGSLRPNFGLDLNSAGGKSRSVLGITDPLCIRRHSFTCTLYHLEKSSEPVRLRTRIPPRQPVSPLEGASREARSFPLCSPSPTGRPNKSFLASTTNCADNPAGALEHRSRDDSLHAVEERFWPGRC